MSGARQHLRSHDVARQIAAAVRVHADLRVAAQARRYFKADDNVQFVGVRTAVVRDVCRAQLFRVQGAWTLEDTIVCADELMRFEELEFRTAALMVLGRDRRRFAPAVLDAAERWLDAGLVADWATTDRLCAMVVSPLLRHFPDLNPRVLGWWESAIHWKRRVSAVFLVPFARRGERLREAYLVVGRLLDDDEDLMHKACGWLLREAGRTDRARLTRFLLKRGPAIPRTTVRYAIEHYPERERQRLLRRTAGRSPKRLSQRPRRRA